MKSIKLHSGRILVIPENRDELVIVPPPKLVTKEWVRPFIETLVTSKVRLLHAGLLKFGYIDKFNRRIEATDLIDPVVKFFEVHPAVCVLNSMFGNKPFRSRKANRLFIDKIFVDANKYLVDNDDEPLLPNSDTLECLNQLIGHKNPKLARSFALVGISALTINPSDLIDMAKSENWPKWVSDIVTYAKRIQEVDDSLQQTGTNEDVAEGKGETASTVDDVTLENLRSSLCADADTLRNLITSTGAIDAEAVDYLGNKIVRESWAARRKEEIDKEEYNQAVLLSARDKFKASLDKLVDVDNNLFTRIHDSVGEVMDANYPEFGDVTSLLATAEMIDELTALADEEIEINSRVLSAPSGERQTLYKNMEVLASRRGEIEGTLLAAVKNLAHMTSIPERVREQSNKEILDQETLRQDKNSTAFEEPTKSDHRKSTSPSGAKTIVVKAPKDFREIFETTEMLPVVEKGRGLRKDGSFVDYKIADGKENVDLGLPKTAKDVLAACGELMSKGWPGLASFTITALVDHYPGITAEILPTAFELASYGWLAARIDDDVELSTTELARLIIDDTPVNEWANGPYDRAVLMALLSGALIPYLRYNDPIMRSMVNDFMIGRYGNAGPLHKLCETLIEAGTFSMPTDFNFLSGDGVLSSWQQRLEGFQNRAENWLEDPEIGRGFQYQHAAQVWTTIACTDATSIKAALNSISNFNKQTVPIIGKAIAELDQPDEVIKRISRKKIVATARRQLRDNINATRSFLTRVRGHLKSDPRKVMNKVDIGTDQFREELVNRLQSVHCFLTDSSWETPFEAGAAHILDDVVTALLNAKERDVAVAPHLTALDMLTCEFLTIDGLTYGGNQSPLLDDRDILIAAVPSAARHISADRVEAFRAAIGRQLDSNAVFAARLLSRVVGYLDGNENQSSIEQQISETMLRASDDLNDRMHSLVNRINLAGAMNLIDEGTRLGFEGSLDACRAMVSRLNSNPVGIKFEGDGSIVDFPQAFKTLNLISDALKESFIIAEKEILDAVDQLEKTSNIDSDTINRVRKMISEGDLMTTREYLTMIENGEILPLNVWRNEALHRFVEDFLPRAEEFYHDAGEKMIHDLALVASGTAKPKKVKLLPEKMGERARAEMARVLDAWTIAMSNDAKRRDSICTIIESGLGFAVRELLSVPGAMANSDSHSTYDITTEVVALPNSFVPPFYGSTANGSYRVVILAKNPTVNTIMQHIPEFHGCGIMLVRTMLTQEDRKTLAVACHKKGLGTLVIDEAMIAFLLTLGGNQLRNFFQVSVPYAAVTPYADTATLPEEMFYGRDKQRQDVINPGGNCLVYGGRRLGKTALLMNVEFRSNRQDVRKRVVYINIENVNYSAPEKAFWTVIIGELKSRGIVKRNVSTPESVIKEIQVFLDADPKNSLLLLLDEADQFIEMEEGVDRNYRNIRHLVSLIEKNHHRFKFIMAGLHNSQRTAKSPNNPLGRLGSPIFIGPFTDRDRFAGLRLVAEPMATMGYEFEDPSLVLRILSQSNYYPALIHIYCQELLKVLHQSSAENVGPPYIVKRHHLDEAYERKDFHEEIRQRFRWSLQLDPRYHLIALIIAMARFERVGLGGKPVPLGVSEIRSHCVDFGRNDIIEDTHTHVFRALLDEMVGLGVLQRIDDGYVLRSANVAVMMGSESEIFDALDDFPTVPKLPMDRSTNRRRLNVNDGFLRSPMTAAQEYNILYSDETPISVLFTNYQEGIDDIVESLESQIRGEAEYRVLDRPIANGEQFVKLIGNWSKRKLVDSKIVFVVRPETGWNARWLRGISGLNKRLAEKQVRIVFLGDADTARILADEGSLPEEILFESIVPWAHNTLRAFLNDVAKSELDKQKIRDKILKASGGIGSWITNIVRQTKTDGRNLDRVLEKMEKSTSGCQKIRRQFGLEGGSLSFLNGLAALLPLRQVEFAELFDLLEDPPVGSASALSRYCEWSGMLLINSRGEFELNPLLSRCVEGSKDGAS